MHTYRHPLISALVFPFSPALFPSPLTSLGPPDTLRTDTGRTDMRTQFQQTHGRPVPRPGRTHGSHRHTHTHSTRTRAPEMPPNSRCCPRNPDRPRAGPAHSPGPRPSPAAAQDPSAPRDGDTAPLDRFNQPLGFCRGSGEAPGNGPGMAVAAPGIPAGPRFPFVPHARAAPEQRAAGAGARSCGNSRGGGGG